ncbi:hypothetical protein [Sphingomonas sp. NFR04]|uniref:hypothetical protein n=1 Tax=Sphingomonas sp. NFR04 TaxID=1566283 RepID=UPI0011144122|nr:hypothetical protein [Sphingomonas sp. NFR04]
MRVVIGTFVQYQDLTDDFLSDCRPLASLRVVLPRAEQMRTIVENAFKAGDAQRVNFRNVPPEIDA